MNAFLPKGFLISDHKTAKSITQLTKIVRSDLIVCSQNLKIEVELTFGPPDFSTGTHRSVLDIFSENAGKSLEEIGIIIGSLYLDEYPHVNRVNLQISEHEPFEFPLETIQSLLPQESMLQILVVHKITKFMHRRRAQPAVSSSFISNLYKTREMTTFSSEFGNHALTNPFIVTPIKIEWEYGFEVKDNFSFLWGEIHQCLYNHLQKLILEENPENNNSKLIEALRNACLEIFLTFPVSGLDIDVPNILNLHFP